MNKCYALYFVTVGLLSLILTLFCGLVCGFQYIIPSFVKSILPFNVMRPLHTLFAVGWVVLTVTGSIYYYLDTKIKEHNQTMLHLLIFVFTGLGIAFSYIFKNFQGKEYLEFPTFFYFPIIFGWILFGIRFFKSEAKSFKKWPVYKWMWATGIVLMIYHFSEAHLWLLPYFKQHFVQNVALQWKAGGSFVGSWNMLVYGTSIYVMSKIGQNQNYAHSKKAFFFYFLGLANLMFGWAHHIYIVPTAVWIRYFAYIISMTEWVVLISIIYDWKKSLQTTTKTSFALSYKLMLMADFWVFLNVLLALLISIPAINLFTHGTHITVAHSMGTTIGINTLILLSSVTYILEKQQILNESIIKKAKFLLNIFNVSFTLFFLCLLLMGVKKSIWIFTANNITFTQLHESMFWLYVLFIAFGLGLIVGLCGVVFILLKGIKIMLNLKLY